MKFKPRTWLMGNWRWKTRQERSPSPFRQVRSTPVPHCSHSGVPLALCPIFEHNASQGVVSNLPLSIIWETVSVANSLGSHPRLSESETEVGPAIAVWLSPPSDPDEFSVRRATLLEWWCSNLNVHTSSQGLLLNCRFKFHRSGVGPKNLHLWLVPRRYQGCWPWPTVQGAVLCRLECHRESVPSPVDTA